MQFSGVEQQLKTNDYPCRRWSRNNANSINTNAGELYRQGSSPPRARARSWVNNKAATWNYTLAADAAASVNVTIKDANGNVVYTEKGDLKQGAGTFTWDGLDSQGNAQANGTYSISMQATDNENKSVNVSTQTAGVADRRRFHRQRAGAARRIGPAQPLRRHRGRPDRHRHHGSINSAIYPVTEFAMIRAVLRRNRSSWRPSLNDYSGDSFPCNRAP